MSRDALLVATVALSLLLAAVHVRDLLAIKCVDVPDVGAVCIAGAFAEVPAGRSVVTVRRVKP